MALSLTGNSAPPKSGSANSEISLRHPELFSPSRDGPKAVEAPAAPRRGPGKFAANAAWSGTADRRLEPEAPAAVAPTRDARSAGAGGVAAPNRRGFPAQRAGAAIARPRGGRRRPTTGRAVARTTSPAPYGAAKYQPGKAKRSGHTRRAGRDWNKRRADRARPAWRNPEDRSRKGHCGGSMTPHSRSGGSAAA